MKRGTSDILQKIDRLLEEEHFPESYWEPVVWLWLHHTPSDIELREVVNSLPWPLPSSVVKAFRSVCIRPMVESISLREQEDDLNAAHLENTGNRERLWAREPDALCWRCLVRHADLSSIGTCDYCLLDLRGDYEQAASLKRARSTDAFLDGCRRVAALRRLASNPSTTEDGSQ